METTEEGRKRLAQVMEREKRGKIAKAGKPADVPVVEGRPDAEGHEVRASEALGEPLRERRDSDEVVSPRKRRQSHRVENDLEKIWMICIMSWKKRKHQLFPLERPEVQVWECPERILVQN